MTTNKPDVKRYDCTSGGSSHCYGCYTMTETELGDYVSSEDYEALQAECEKLRKDAERYRHLRDRLTSPRFDNIFFLELHDAGCFGHPDDVDEAIDDALDAAIDIREDNHD